MLIECALQLQGQSKAHGSPSASTQGNQGHTAYEISLHCSIE